MAQIKTPKVYHSEPDAIVHLGGFARDLGNRALIIGGSTALTVAGERVSEQLKDAHIDYETEVYFGRPTSESSQDFAALARRMKADFIVGVGGGRAIDTAKWAACASGLPTIAVPTVAATCAAFAATIVTYDQSGASTGFFVPPQSPVAVFADTQIIAAAPPRYLRAGLADTLAKWYENLPDLRNTDSLYLHQQLVIARLAVDVITKHAPTLLPRLEVSADAKNTRKASPNASWDSQDIGSQTAFIELVDAIILLAGLVGSITANTNYAGLAHPFYTASTYLRQMDGSLHGERVAYGLLAQAVAMKENRAYFEELLELLELLEQPLTLKQLGVAENDHAAIAILAQKTMEYTQGFRLDDQDLNAAYLQEVFTKTDEHRYGGDNQEVAA
jgi:glycerol dehydrogenase